MGCPIPPHSSRSLESGFSNQRMAHAVPLKKGSATFKMPVGSATTNPRHVHPPPCAVESLPRGGSELCPQSETPLAVHSLTCAAHMLPVRPGAHKHSVDVHPNGPNCMEDGNVTRQLGRTVLTCKSRDAVGLVAPTAPHGWGLVEYALTLHSAQSSVVEISIDVAYAPSACPCPFRVMDAALQLATVTNAMYSESGKTI